MATIRPFKGLMYNQEIVKDLSKVVTPPYDVISPQEQDMYYERDKYNSIRLILGKQYPTDTDSDNRYTRAAKTLNEWINNKILITDEKPAIYVYEQKYSIKGEGEKIRRGFISLIKLEDYSSGGVRPHEKTFEGPKADRLNLTRACKTNFSCVFALYSDAERKIEKLLDEGVKGGKLIVDIIDDHSEGHKLWRITDTNIINKIADLMKEKSLFIADGHHRYETGINYRNEMRAKTPNYTGEEIFNYTMATMVSMECEGLTILPTHRVIHSIQEDKIKALPNKLKEFFDIDDFEFNTNNEKEIRGKFISELRKRGETKHTIGMILKGNNKYSLLTLKDENSLDKFNDGTHSKEWMRLDVSILHKLILEQIGPEVEGNIEYVKDDDKAIDMILDKSNKFQASFLLNATKKEEIKKIAELGEKMPQKSTFFYPKLITGLVMNYHLAE